ncbi:neurobeachin-like protein 1 [Platysternon megacephalum]|uniref:Neurobeachin-like protein 1 n=1 Tax=Platysternon megacephalum TaxID=55544 RepID=A0A4D9ESE4_9SAUR|nr:neurobeachin-like protein 1 [Platysternon megacephalum]
MTVEFEECIKDSPRFRATIDEVETDVVEIEAKLDKLEVETAVSKLCKYGCCLHFDLKFASSCCRLLSYQWCPSLLIFQESF